MSSRDEATTAATEECGDLEYDLAHEAVGIDPDSSTEAPSEGGVEPSTQVGNQTAGYDGDYGYDLAHDLPKPDRPPDRR